MNKGVKIFFAVVVSLAIISGIFLIFAKKKTPAAAPQTAQSSQQATSGLVTKSTTIPAVQNPAANSTTNKPSTVVKKAPLAQSSDAAKKSLVRSQWQQCKNKTITSGTSLFWNLQISEAIPASGTYAKGLLDNDSAYPMHITIKSGAANADLIKKSLTVGKMLFLRGTCAGVDPDSSVIFQTF